MANAAEQPKSTDPGSEQLEKFQAACAKEYLVDGAAELGLMPFPADSYEILTVAVTDGHNTSSKPSTDLVFESRDSPTMTQRFLQSVEECRGDRGLPFELSLTVDPQQRAHVTVWSKDTKLQELKEMWPSASFTFVASEPEAVLEG